MSTLVQGRNALITAVAVILLGGLLANQFLFAPMRERIAQNEERIATLEGQVQTGLRARAIAARLEREIAELKKKNAELANRLPSRENYTDLMDAVTKTAEDRLGLRIEEIGRTPPRPVPGQPGVYVGRLQLRLVGGFADLYRFLAYLEERIERFSRIAEVTISPAPKPREGEKPAEVTAGVELEFYFQEGPR